MKKNTIFCLFLMLTIFTSSTSYGDNTDNNKEKIFPEKYDLRELKKTTPVRTQGSIESYWAISFLDSLESNMKTIGDEEMIFSVNNMITSTSKLYKENYNREPGDGGDQAMATAYVASWEGPVLQSEDPYAVNGKEENIKLRMGLSATKHVQEVLFLPERKNALDNDIIKEMVMKYGGVSASIRSGNKLTDDEFYNPEKSTWYCPKDYMSDEENRHAVTIVGWDDDFSRDNFIKKPDGDGAFIVKNTDGYLYISYFDMMLGTAREANVGMSAVTRIDDADNYDRIYQHDPLGYTKKYTPEGDKNSVFFMNTFKTENRTTLREKLAAVAFYTLDPDLDYEIYIRDSLKIPRSIDEMNLIKKGNISLPGYHTIDINMENVMYPGRKITVGIRLTSKDGTPSIAIESPEGFTKSSATSNFGESHVMNESGDIVDLLDISEDSNNCIKIFTDEIYSYNTKLLTTKEMKEDLDYVVKRLQKFHIKVVENGFTDKQKQIIEDAYKKVEMPMMEQEFYLVINRIFTMNNDAQVSIFKKFSDRYMDLSFQWIEEGIFINRDSEDFKVGDEILSIGGRTAEELNDMLYDQISDENDFWIRQSSENYLISRNYAKYFNLMNADNTVDILLLREGEEVVVRGEFPLVKVDVERNNGIEGIYSWHIEKENDLAYFRLDNWISNRDSRYSGIKREIDKFFKQVKDNEIKNFVLDIRENQGGSTPVFEYMMKYIDTPMMNRDVEYKQFDDRKKVGKDLVFKGETYVMTSYKTFGCNMLALRVLRGNKVAKILGESIGVKSNFNIQGNTADGFLPNTKWDFTMTAGRIDRVDGSNKDETTLTPDIVVNRRASDIVADRDIQMEKMREITRGDDNISYAENSINLPKGDNLNINKGSDTEIITLGKEGNEILTPFVVEQVKGVYLQDTVTLEKRPLTLEESIITMPEDMKNKTHYLVFELKNSGKKYKILINMIKKINREQVGKIVEYTTENGVWKRYYEEKKQDMRFAVHNEYRYLFLNFNRAILKQDIADKIQFTHNGKKIKITQTLLARSSDEYLLLCYKDQLAPGDGYNVVIPKNSVRFKDGEGYSKELNFSFEVPEIEGALRISYRKEDNSLSLSSNQEIVSHKLMKAKLVDSQGIEIYKRGVKLSYNKSYITVRLPRDFDPDKEYTLTIPEGCVKFKFSGENKKPLVYKFKVK